MRKVLLLFIFAQLFGCNNSTKKLPWIPISAESAYGSIIDNLDPEHPGRGLDVFDERKLDRPMAYALILSAESNRYKFSPDSLAFNRIRRCGNWLLENPDLNDNGIYGYGLADEWDAFNDSTVNPAHEEYVITTAMAVNGLLDWYDIETDSSTKSKILQCVQLCLEPFLTDKYDSPIGIPAYSFNVNEAEKDCFNPAAYLLGPLRRLASTTQNDSLINLYEVKSDKIMKVLIDNQLSDINGNIYWNHGIQILRPNDMVHACYIIEGIREYADYSGRLEVQWEKTFNHLNLFYVDNRWYEFVEEKYQNENYNSRLWGMGMLMYSLAKEGEYKKIEQTLWPQIEEYHMGNGEFALKTNDNRSMVRQDAHLLLGLSYYLYHENLSEGSKN